MSYGPVRLVGQKKTVYLLNRILIVKYKLSLYMLKMIRLNCQHWQYSCLSTEITHYKYDITEGPVSQWYSLWDIILNKYLYSKLLTYVNKESVSNSGLLSHKVLTPSDSYTLSLTELLYSMRAASRMDHITTIYELTWSDKWHLSHKMRNLDLEINS